MTIVEYYNNGTLKDLYKKGIVPSSVLLKVECYKKVKEIRAKGVRANQAYDLASDEMRCSKRTIIRAVKFVGDI